MTIILGYGYRCSPKDLQKHGADPMRIFIDEMPSRPMLQELFKALREDNDDIVVVLARTHFGRGKTIPLVEEAIRKTGATIKLVDAGEEDEGYNSAFKPTKEQSEILKPMWKNPGRYPLQYVLQQVERLTGKPVKRSALYREYGKRKDV